MHALIMIIKGTVPPLVAQWAFVDRTSNGPGVNTSLPLKPSIAVTGLSVIETYPLLQVAHQRAMS